MRRIMAMMIGTLCGIVAASAQSLRTDEGMKHWETNFLVGLNTDGSQFDFGIAYFPFQFIGVKAQIGLAGEIEELGDLISDDIYVHHHYTTRFKFNPAFALRTPRLISWKSQDAGFYLFAEPGIILSPGASGSKRAEHFNWDLKCGINLQIDCFVVTVGYGISDFFLYSGCQHNHMGVPDSHKYTTHSGFIGGAYKF